MKEKILNFLATKSNREFHPLNLLIKGNANVKTREQVQAIKRELRSMEGIEFTGLDQLDAINNDGHNPSFPNGTARPTQYFNFDTTNVSARGLKDAAPAPAPGPVRPVPPVKPAAAAKPVTVLPSQSPTPVVEGHPLDVPQKEDDSEARLKVLHDALVQDPTRREDLSQELKENELPE